MFYANIYWDLAELRKSDFDTNDPMIHPVFLGVKHETRKSAEEGIITGHMMLHYIDTIEVPDFEGAMAEMREKFNESDTAEK